VRTRTADLYRVNGPRIPTSNNLNNVGGYRSARKHGEDGIVTSEITGEEFQSDRPENLAPFTNNMKDAPAAFFTVPPSLQCLSRIRSPERLENHRTLDRGSFDQRSFG